MFSNNSWAPLSNASNALSALAVERANRQNYNSLIRFSQLTKEAVNNSRRQLFWISPNFRNGIVFSDIDSWLFSVRQSRPQSQTFVIWYLGDVVAVAVGSMAKSGNELQVNVEVAYREEGLEHTLELIEESVGSIYFEYAGCMGMEVIVQSPAV